MASKWNEFSSIFDDGLCKVYMLFSIVFLLLWCQWWMMHVLLAHLGIKIAMRCDCPSFFLLFLYQVSCRLQYQYGVSIIVRYDFFFKHSWNLDAAINSSRRYDSLSDNYLHRQHAFLAENQNHFIFLAYDILSTYSANRIYILTIFLTYQVKCRSKWEVSNLNTTHGPELTERQKRNCCLQNWKQNVLAVHINGTK